ncbi:MAG: DUF962 domain-containing protein [Myxococcales bacterium]|nr:DUF962 domain-containing protein [Myxococcales bacterium]
MTPPRSFSEFWPYYLGEHRNPLNRALHYVGTFCALSLLGYIITRQYWGLMLVGLVIGYGPAWVGHFFIENNKPASFKYPLWSFMADVKMLVLKLGGAMEGEMTRLYGSAHPAPDAPLRRGPAS